MIEFAALYVRADGPYPSMTPHWYGVERDARSYTGVLPVVAHPPCKRWGRWWWADGSIAPGNDGGLFAHALGEIRRCGGIIEHPEGSHAFREFDLPHPVIGAWSRGLFPSEWSTCVSQGAYGHRARKLTWLFFVGDYPPPLKWKIPEREFAYLCPPGRRKNKPGRSGVELLTAKENEVTPQPFANMLAGIVQSRPSRHAQAGTPG